MQCACCNAGMVVTRNSNTEWVVPFRRGCETRDINLHVEHSSGSHLPPNTSWKFLLAPLSKGHCVTLCFSNISIVVTFNHTIRTCIPSNPPRLSANAMSTMNAKSVSANLREMDT